MIEGAWGPERNRGRGVYAGVCVFKEQETEAEPDGWERWRESVYKCSDAAQSVLVMTQLTPHIAANPSSSLASLPSCISPALLPYPPPPHSLRLRLRDAAKDAGSNWSPAGRRDYSTRNLHFSLLLITRDSSLSSSSPLTKAGLKLSLCDENSLLALTVSEMLACLVDKETPEEVEFPPLPLLFSL